MTLFEFETEASVARWHTENDVVMGGVSTSRIVHATDATLAGCVGVFSGEVSLENDGGFAQILYDESALDLGGFAGIELHVRGDGRRYDLRFETDADEVSYAHPFSTDGSWQRVRLDFADFQPTHHGHDVPDAPALNLKAIRTVGFLIGGQEGPFELRLDEVSTYEA